jgi:cytochrome c
MMVLTAASFVRHDMPFATMSDAPMLSDAMPQHTGIT